MKIVGIGLTIELAVFCAEKEGVRPQVNLNGFKERK